MLIAQVRNYNRINIWHWRFSAATYSSCAFPIGTLFDWPVQTDELWLEQLKDDPGVFLHDEARLRHVVGDLLAVVVLHVELELYGFVLFVGIGAGGKDKNMN